MFCFSTGHGWERFKTLRMVRRTWVSLPIADRPYPMLVHAKFCLLGVVIAPDIVTSDSSLHSLPVPEDKLEFVLIQGGNRVHRSGVKNISTNMEGLKMFNLLDPIPEEMFRPVCLPPPGYISRMVKPSSCQKGGGKLLKVRQVLYSYIGFSFGGSVRQKPISIQSV